MRVASSLPGLGPFSKKQIKAGNAILLLATFFTLAEVLVLKIVHRPALEVWFFENLIGLPDWPPHAHAWFSLCPEIRWLHPILGSVFLALAPFQLNKRFRAKSLARHRWMGRVAVLASFSAGMGLVQMAMRPGYLYACTPIVDEKDFPSLHNGDIDREQIRVQDCSDTTEWWAVVVFGTHFLVSLAIAMYNVYASYWATNGKERSRRTSLHKMWMIRHFANGVSVAIFRLVNVVFSYYTSDKLDPAGRRMFFGYQLVVVWMVDLILAELFIRNHIPEAKRLQTFSTNNIVYLPTVESFAARANLAVVLLVIVWKSVGMEWLPGGFAQAWADIFDTYYPRYESHEREYNMFYIVFYGLFGLAGQVASLKLCSEPTNKRAKQIFGLFHVLMAIYHVLFAFRVVRGKFSAIDDESWWPFAPTVQVLYSMCLVASLDFLLSASYQAQRKIALDLVTMGNVLPLACLLTLTRCGVKSVLVGKLIVSICMIAVPFVVLYNECKEVLKKFSGAGSEKLATDTKATKTASRWGTMETVDSFSSVKND